VKARRVARKLALDCLYEAEIRDELPTDALEAHSSATWEAPAETDAEPGDEMRGAPLAEARHYTRVLVEGVQEHQAAIDALIARYADRWTIERMPVIDRNLVRIALFELLWRDDVPVAVAINEVVELAKELSTDDSGRFINGLLGRIVEKELVR
jgi:N utilization substance protein B